MLKVLCGLIIITLVACQPGKEQSRYYAAQLSIQGEQLRKQGNFQAALEKQQEALQ